MSVTLWDFDHIYTVGDVAATGKVAPETLLAAINYANPYAAITAAQHNTLVLVAPGVYKSSSSNRIRYTGKVAIRGLGETPTDVRFTRTNRNDAEFSPNSEVIFENIHVQGLENSSGDNLFVSQNAVASAVYSRTLLELRSTRADSGHYLEGSRDNAQSGPILFRHSTLRRKNSGYTFNCSSGVTINRPRFSWSKTVVSPSLSIRAGAYSGDWASSDYVEAPAPDYGHLSGEYYIDLVGVPVSGRVRDLRNLALPNVVVFSWDRPSLFLRPMIAATGEWEVNVPKGHKYGIYYLSSDNRCPPIIHGPYTAE